ncbi:hypothetical protein YWY31_15610 [Paenibacillus illinoisensis]|uniref:paeninodin family lasso peptide n=1 Tax=Paenibacillus illinoisensis TaxID=59845 RepID=UPI0034C09064
MGKQPSMENRIKRTWKTPQLEVLDISETMNGGEGIWQYVWDGDFWKLELLTS